MSEHDPVKDLLKKHSPLTPEAPEWGATQTWSKILEQRSLQKSTRWSWLKLAIPALALPSVIALVVFRPAPALDDAQIQLTENSILAIYADADMAAFDDSLGGEEVEDWIP